MFTHSLKKLIPSLVLALVFSSCIDDVEMSEKGQITSFHIFDQANATGINSISFYITQPLSETALGSITNSEKLFPYGSLDKKLIPTFTTEGASNVYLKTVSEYTDNDTLVTITSGVTAIDFSTTRSIIVFSEDQKNFIQYLVTIETEPTNPEQVIWERLTDSVDFDLKEDFSSFYLGDKIFVLTGEIFPSKDSIYTKLVSSTNGESWDEVALPADFPRGIHHSICVFNNKVYIVGYVSWNTESHNFEGKEEIWSSTDGQTWTKNAYPSGMNNVFKNIHAYNKHLLVWGGSQVNANTNNPQQMLYGDQGELLNPDHSFWSFDGSTWTQLDDLNPEIPIRFSSACLYQERLQVFGGEYENGEASNQFWSFLSDNKWYNFPTSNVEILRDATLINYDNNLWLFGGNTFESTIYTIRVSFDGGKIFSNIHADLEKMMGPDLRYTSRAGQDVVMSPNNTIYVIGGYNSVYNSSLDINLSAQVDTTYLYDVWKAKMNKFQ